MKPKKYFSIGEFSKISGLSIKALRYYEKIGILTPSYTDPSSLYRYYTRDQLKITNIILLSLFLNIPLNVIKNKFIKDGVINYDEFTLYSKNEIIKKIDQLKSGLNMIDLISQQKKIQDKCNFDEYLPFNHNKTNLLICPFEGEVSSIEYDKAIANLFDLYPEENVSYLYGILKQKENGLIKQYIFIALTNMLKVKNPNHKIITLPKQDLYFKLSTNPSLEDVDSLLMIYEIVEKEYKFPTYLLMKGTI